MTLIIGFKFNNGVLLVSDRKAINYNENKIKWISKLHSPLENSTLFYGASGSLHLFEEFNRKVPHIIEQRLKEYEIKNYSFLKQHGINYYKLLENNEGETLPKPPFVYGHEGFIEDCQLLIQDICLNEENADNNLEVLSILFDKKFGAKLFKVNFNEKLEDNYFAIGSGSIFVNEFLDKFYNKEKDIEHCMKLALFCINYIQDFIKDYSVGLETNTLPDNIFILNDGTTGTYKFKNKTETLKETTEKVNQFILLQNNLNFN